MSSKTPIDLSRIPAPKVVEELDFETLYDQMRAELIARDPDLAEVLALESEPLSKLLQVTAFREMLVRQRVNEAAKAVMLAYALGSDLDNLGALLNVERLQISPGDPDATPPIPPEMESDDDFRLRIQLSLDGLSTAGPERAYVFHALSADAQVLDVTAESPTFAHADVDQQTMDQLPPDSIVLQVVTDAGLTEPRPGDVAITVLARDGDGTADQALLDTVNTALSAEDVRPLTDLPRVRSAEIIPYTIEANLYMFPGPDTDVVLATAQEQVEQFVTENRRLGRDIIRSGIFAALHVAGVQRVELVSPAADIVCSSAQAAHATSVTVTAAGTAS